MFLTAKSDIKNEKLWFFTDFGIGFYVILVLVERAGTPQRKDAMTQGRKA
jgi:hypothetical protein